MPTVFRFAAQTADHRYSEVWSFFCNDGKGDVYATRTSMSKWLKASFHESGACHVKIKQEKNDPTSWEREFEWRSSQALPQTPSHLLRIIFPLNMQRAVFERSNKVKLHFEEWPHQSQGALNLHMFMTVGDIPPSSDWGEIIVSHNLDTERHLHFAVDFDRNKHELPEPVNGMTMHLGEAIRNGNNLLGFRKATAVWYSLPISSGALTITEGSWEFLDMKEFEAPESGEFHEAI